MGTSDDLNPQNTDNLHNDGSVTMTDQTRAVALVELSNGKLILITTERNSGHDGIASFEIDNDPGSPGYGTVINPGTTDADAIIDTVGHATAGVGYDEIESIAALTFSNGNTFVYTADPPAESIGITQIAPDGTLTALPALTDGTNLNNVGDITLVEVGGQSFLLALAGGSSDNLLSYSIDDTTGDLTQVSDIGDGTGTAENFLAHDGPLDASFVEAFTDSSGNGYVLAGSAEDGISLFSIDGTGTLTFQNARGDDMAGTGETDPEGNDLGRDLIAPVETGLANVDAAAFAEIDGQVYVFVGGADADVSVFRIDPDAAADGTFDLTLVGQIDDMVNNISALHVIESLGGKSYLVQGGEEKGLNFAEIVVDPVTGIVTFDIAGGMQLADAGEPGPEYWDVEDIVQHDGIIATASDRDQGVAIATAVVCFAVNVQIMTEFGELPIQDLRVGDRVLTLDRGFQPIRWIGSRQLSASELEASPGWRAVRIARGAFGPNVPSRPLKLSRQHRVFIAPGPDGEAALLPVKDCLDLDGVDEPPPSGGISYFHILMDRHDIVFANGQSCETLWTGEMVREDLESGPGFPAIDMADYTPARRFLKGAEARARVSARKAGGGPMVPARFMRLDPASPRPQPALSQEQEHAQALA